MTRKTTRIRIDPQSAVQLPGKDKPGVLALLEAVGSPVFVLQEQHIVYANQAFSRLTGLDIIELHDMLAERLVHPDDINLFRLHLQDENSTERPTLRIGCKDERPRQVDLRATLIELDDALLTVCFVYDLTERIAAEQGRRSLIGLLSQTLDGDPVPTFVINAQHIITHWNRACQIVTGTKASEIVGTSLQWQPFYPAQRPALADVVVDQSMDSVGRQLYGDRLKASPTIPGAFEVTSFFPHFGKEGRWLYFTAAPLRDEHNDIIGAIETLQDVTERVLAEKSLRQHQLELERLLSERTEALEATSAQLIQSEKLASIGQLAAGVAHEINNPIGYVHSNIGSLESYMADLFKLLDHYEKRSPDLAPEAQAELAALRRKVDVEYLKEDIPQLIRESREGITRVKKIIQNLKDFSRVDSDQGWQWADIHQGLESTLNIVNNELKYKADIIKEYGNLPQIECRISQLNQVFMNLLVNAAQAMGDERGTITIKTHAIDDDRIVVQISDTGSGIPDHLIKRIFDPFFTTKPVGTGTGLGLSLSYGIIQSHQGKIEVQSNQGEGSCFTITLPIAQHQAEPTA